MSEPGQTVILFVGGVSPKVTNEELSTAFHQRQAPLLATSIVRQPENGDCIGQAYVTVEVRHAAAAKSIAEVGGNAVAVFEITLEAWTAVAEPTQPGPQPYTNSFPTDPRLAATAAASVPAPAHGPTGTGVVAAGPTAPQSGASGSTLLPPPTVGMGVGASALDTVGSLPSTHHSLLQGVFDQLRAYLLCTPRVIFNGKPYYMLLHEACQKKLLLLQVFDSTEGTMFICNITALRGQAPVCSGRASGSNKKDAKHNAAAACLENMLSTGQITAAELLSAMTSASSSAAGTSLPVISSEVSASVAAASTTAMSQTQAIMRLGLYPRCSEVMSLVHSTDAGRIKTVLMVLNEYAVRSRMTVLHEDVSGGGLAQPTGPFRFQSRMADTATGAVVAEAMGADLRSKQEAKQSAAAALIESLVSRGMASVEAVARGR